MTETVFITKHALKFGIEEREVVTRDRDGYVTVKVPKAPNGVAYYTMRNWASTREQAVADANYLRNQKIKSLEAQIKRLKALTF